MSMIKESLARLEAAIKTIETTDSQKKAELLKLYASLKAEVEGLTKAHGEQARSIAGFAEVAAHEATRKGRSKRLLQLSTEGLEASVQGFESSHPRLTAAVNEVCLFLARIGM